MSARNPHYLLLNGFNVFRLRLPVPKHLRPVIKQREIKRSLRTGNRKEALRKARILAGKYQEAFDYMSRYDKEVEELLNNPLAAHIKLSAEKKPDGTILIKDLKMDPDKVEREKELLDHAIEKLNEIRVEPASLVPSSETGQSTLLKNLIHEYLEDASENIKDAKTLKGYKSQLHTFLEILGNVPVQQKVTT